MAMRLQELHPALVHFPITLFPTTLGLDAIGRFSGDRTLLELGRRGMMVTTGALAVAGIAGLIAQEAVRLDEDGHQKLVTHRNLNLGLLGLAATMAIRRSRRERPSLRYLVAGLVGTGVMTYSAYLGGNMVYDQGVGVLGANGVSPEKAPRLVPGGARDALVASARNVAAGTKHAVQDLGQGEIIPWLVPAGGNGRGPAVREEEPRSGAVHV